MAAEAALLGLEVRLADLIRGVESRLAAQLDALGASFPQGNGIGLEDLDLVQTDVEKLSVLNERCPDDDNAILPNDLGKNRQDDDAEGGEHNLQSRDRTSTLDTNVNPVLSSSESILSLPQDCSKLKLSDSALSWVAVHLDSGAEGHKLEPFKRREELDDMISKSTARRRHVRQRKTSHFSGFSHERTEDPLNQRCLDRHYGLRPDGMARLAFDLVSVFAVLYDSTLQPISLAWEIRNSSMLYFFSMCSLIFWTLDMFLNFMTGYYTSGGELELRLGKICRRYVKGWFLCDFTINGLDWVGIFLEFADDSGSSGNSTARDISKAGRLVRTARILRIFRIVLRLKTLSRAIISPRTKTGLQAVQILTLVVWINHLLGCLWFGVGRLSEGWYNQTWLDRVDGGLLGIPYGETSIVYQYFTAMHWSITQMTPGSMEVFPTNPLERILNIFCLIFGLLFGTSLTSQLSATMVQINMSRQKELAEVQDLRQYLQENKITTELARCIQEQIRLRMSVAKPKIEKNVRALEVLSGTLRLQLESEIFTQLLNRHPLFNVWACTEQHVVKDLCRLNALERIIVNPGDELFNPNSKPDAVYLVLDGMLRYCVEEDNHDGNSHGRMNDKEEDKVGVGAWLCEPALWLDWSHKGTMVAVSTSVLLKVSVPAVLEFMKRHVDAVGLVDAWSCAVARIANSHRHTAHVLDSGIDHGLVVMAMPDEARSRTVGISLDQLQSEEAPTNWFKGRKDFSELAEEAEAGKSVVIREGTGNVVRTVLVMVLRVSREDGKILVQLAKCKANGWEPAVQLPGKKLAAQEEPSIVANDFLGNQLSFLKLGLDNERFEREVAMKHSEDFGVTTRYHSLVFEVRAEGAEDAGAGDPLTGSSSGEVRKTNTSLRSSIVEELGLDIASNDLVEHAVDKGQMAMYAWITDTDFHELQEDVAPLRKFLNARFSRDSRIGSVRQRFSSFRSGTSKGSSASIQG